MPARIKLAVTSTLFLAGLAAALGAGWIANDHVTGTEPHSIVLFVALVCAASLLLGLAVVSFLRRRGDAPEGGGDYRHMTRLAVVTIVTMGLLGLGLEALVPEGFGKYGPYRGGALDDIRESARHHIGEAGCADCHAKQLALHDKDAHARVACEACHGPGQRHAEYHAAHEVAKDGTSAVPDDAQMLVRSEREWCLRCHAIDPARPGAFPQIEWQDHMRLVGVKDPTLACGKCHDPHEPLFMDRDLRDARLHPLVQECDDCHSPGSGAAVKADDELPPEHPETFQCAYCHSEVAKEFEQGKHKDLACTTCHVFYKESAFAGRIIRDADPRFCLLCHRKSDFRSEEAAPGIKWPGHRKRMRDGPEDKRQVCVECHRPALHYPEPPPEEDDLDDDDLFGDEDEETPEDDETGEEDPE